MKISPLLALFTVCAPLAAPFAAQGQINVAPDALPMAPQSASTVDAWVWRFAPPVGSKWTMRSFARSISHSYNPVSDGPVPHEEESVLIQKITADYDVLSRDALGATTIRLTLRTLANETTMKADSSIRKYWSADPSSVNGTTLTIKQSREGKIWGVVGLHAFQRKTLETTSFGHVMIDTMLDPNPMTGSSEMVKTLSQMVGTLPTSPIRVGESWNYDMSSPRSLPLDLSGARTLKSLDSDVAVVVTAANFTGEKSRQEVAATPLTSEISPDFTHLKGSISTVSRVQRSSGLPLEFMMNQSVKGGILKQTMAAKGIGMQNESEPFDVTFSRRIVLEPRE